MPTLTSDQIADLVLATLDDLGRAAWTDLTTDIQEFSFMPQILKKERVQFGGGAGIKRQVMVKHSGAAEHQGLYETDTVSVQDVMQQARVPWRHTSTNWAYEDREMAMNTGASEIYDLVKTRRADSLIALTELMEETFWTQPALTTDTKTPYSIYYWAPKYPSGTTALGFNGGNPLDQAGTSFSDCAGLNATTYPRWSSFTGQYTLPSKTDLIKKWRKACTYTKFMSPIEMPNYARGKDRMGYYVNYTTLSALEEIGESQNENLGRDIASMDGMIMFRRRPVTWVPYLDADTAGDPVIGINWSTFYPYFLRGEYLHEQPPEKASNQHRTKECFIDLSWNTLCVDRRRNFVLSKDGSS